MKKSARNIEGLLFYSTAKKQETEGKVFIAIEKLKRSKTKAVNFKSVSELSGVSTTTLYNNPIIRERISSLRSLKRKPVEDKPVGATSSLQRLRKEIRRLKEQKRLLVIQLVEMESVKAENERLKALLTKVKRE